MSFAFADYTLSAIQHVAFYAAVHRGTVGTALAVYGQTIWPLQAMRWLAMAFASKTPTPVAASHSTPYFTLHSTPRSAAAAAAASATAARMGTSAETTVTLSLKQDPIPVHDALLASLFLASLPGSVEGREILRRQKQLWRSHPTLMTPMPHFLRKPSWRAGSARASPGMAQSRCQNLSGALGIASRRVPPAALASAIPNSKITVAELLGQHLPVSSAATPSGGAVFSHEEVIAPTLYDGAWRDTVVQAAQYLPELRWFYNNPWLSGAISIKFPSPSFLSSLDRKPAIQHRRLPHKALLLAACAHLAAPYIRYASQSPLSPAVRLTTQNLALFLSNEWLTDDMINAGVDYILQRVGPGSRIRIMDCLFISSLRQARAASATYPTRFFPIVVSECARHETKSTAAAVRQRGRVASSMAERTAPVEPTLRETLLKRLAAEVPTSDTINKTTGLDHYIQHTGSFAGPEPAGSKRAENKATVQAVAASGSLKFVQLRATAMKSFQHLHENMYCANITAINPLRSGYFVLAMKPGTARGPHDVVLGEVLEIYTKNTNHDWIPTAASVGTPSYIYITVYRRIARAMVYLACMRTTCLPHRAPNSTHTYPILPGFVPRQPA
ncbi:hypothetical protein C8R47DRAFT_1228233 [Mycena vitilis]|nr:hypothetical protein C8R47DRAFT_1228233 [Mycena vitilis]